ncbi:hypothetical protein [Streptomyces subrutilus]|uniref:Calcium-binding protein n=1 Tax=Streptomyces subrutilus TaxID=36818 RepID=A0A1E5NXR3_9ACTN|nr:hypothetical protein [Streptomyces subrutilus]OEJ21042.1 hypothetical protein BGK67_34665 [Streptomyces subrutilus]
MRFLRSVRTRYALLAAGTALVVGSLAGVAHDAVGRAEASEAALVEAFNDGFVDGRADGMGDDNRDGVVDEDESGWDCRTMGNRVCGADVPPECTGAGDALPLCVTVAARPAYTWTAANGQRVDVADGRTEIRNLPEKPGTEDFAAVITALDAEWNAAH